MVDDETQRTDEGSEAEAEAVDEHDAAAEAAAAAFAETIGLFHDDMARVAFVVSGDAELAGAAAQGAWPEAWKDIATPRNPERLRAWLMGLAAKEAKWLTDAGARAREDAARGDPGVLATQAATTSAYRSEELDLANAFAALDSHDRQIIGLRYVAGLTSDDIGRELGMPGSAVQARVARILKVLLQAVRGLEAEGDAVEAYERALSQRIRAFANRAVVPLDPEAIAKDAIAQAASEVSTADRLAAGAERALWSESVRPARCAWALPAGRSWSCSPCCSWPRVAVGRRPRRRSRPMRHACASRMRSRCASPRGRPMVPIGLRPSRCGTSPAPRAWSTTSPSRGSCNRPRCRCSSAAT